MVMMLSRSDKQVLFVLVALVLLAVSMKMIWAPKAPQPVSALSFEPERININTASKQELTRLPGIGPLLAQRIIEYREAHGRFEAIEELMSVKGIGHKIFEKIKDKITVD